MSRDTGVTRVFIIHSDADVRARVRQYLEQTDTVALVGEADGPPTTPDTVLEAAPDLALVDVNSSTDGIQLCRELLAREPDIRCLVLASSQDDEPLLTALLIGAAGYILARDSGEDVVAAIRHVSQGGSLLDAQLTEGAGGTPAQMEPDPRADLTRQELRIAECIAEGLSNPEIAERLHLSRHTVRNHLSEILRKFGARNRVELATFMTRLALARRFDQRFRS